LTTWQQVQRQDYRVVSIDQKALLIGSWLLAMLAIASIAVVVGGRLAEQTRRVGLLKAVGATPRLVAAVLLAENLLLALAGAAAGLILAVILVPSFANPGRGLLGAPPSPSLTSTSIVEVVLAALALATAATIVPAVRGARTSTIGALNEPAHPPARRPCLIALSARLPVPLLLGLRLTARRLRRTILTGVSVAIAVAMVVAAVTLQHQVDLRQQNSNPIGLFISSENALRVSHLVWILGAVLVVLASLNAIFTSWATVIDAERPTALARALGATPRQISGGLTAAQLLPGLVAACIGIPAGLGLFGLAGGHLTGANRPSVPLLIAVIPCTLAAVALLTFIPARAGARRSVADVLRAE
jgi:putative ABC transport system permease protein